MRITIILSVFFLFLLAGSCEKEIKLDIPGYQEQIVIDGFIETDQPPFVLLSNTKNIYAATDLNSFLNGFISGAIVTVSDGTTTIQLDEICSDNLPVGSEALAAAIFGVPESELANYHLCAYTSFNSAIFGVVGKTYTLTVQYEGKTYTASSKIEQPRPLNKLFWKPEPKFPNADYGFSYAEMTDPANEYNAYRWEVKRINLDSTGNPRDLIFHKPFTPFADDEFFNGLTFEFWYENPMSFDDENLANEYKGYYKLGDTLVVKFSTLDKYVFEFMEKKYTQIATGGSPFASPSNIPSNIKGGALGVWAAYSPVFDTLICKP